MNVIEARHTLLMAFSVPDYARVDFYKKAQRESGISEEVFLRMLFDAFKYWIELINNKEKKLKAYESGVTDLKLSFLSETNTGLIGHFGIFELYDGILPALATIADELKEKEDLEIHNNTPGDEIKVAAHSFVILWELGLIDELKTKGQANYSELGKFLEVLTGKRSGDFRKAIGQHEPSEHSLFNENSLKEAAKILDSYGIKHPKIDKKIKGLKK